MLTLNL